VARITRIDRGDESLPPGIASALLYKLRSRYERHLSNAIIPRLKVTSPVAAPRLDVTLAVKLTELPYVDGFWEDVTVVEVVNCRPTAIRCPAFWA